VWDPGRVNANADRATDDPTTIAYLGELDYGGSAVSLPVTNKKRILQVSPEDGLTSLTATPPGRPRSGPERYYPSGVRTFLRLVPSDLLAVETMLAEARAAGAHRLGIVIGEGIYAQEMAAEVAALARSHGPDPVVGERLGRDPADVPALVRKLAAARPDAIVFAGVAGPSTRRLLAGLARALPAVPVIGAAGLLAASPTGAAAAPDRVEALSGVRPGAAQPASGRRLLRALRALEGPAAARPGALYGYESVRIVFDAIERAGAGGTAIDRVRVARAALEIRRRRSVIGAFQVRATGAVGQERLGRYRLRDGRFSYAGDVR
jgi:branched-chain amino acid transport system substrate-binding protein